MGANVAKELGIDTDSPGAVIRKEFINTLKQLKGPGYSNPKEALKNGPREKILYVPLVVPHDEKKSKADYIATIDVDPESEDYCKVIHRLVMPYAGDDLHASGWSVSSICNENNAKIRNRLILTSLGSDRIYVIDVGTNPTEPRFYKIIEPVDIHKKTGLGAPYTTFPLPSGEVMISSVGDSEGNATKAGFILLDGQDFTILDNWEKGEINIGSQFSFKPRQDVLVSTEFGAISVWRNGFRHEHVAEGHYGHNIHFWQLSAREKLQTIDLGPDGSSPLAVRFLHEPSESTGFVACALTSTVFRFFKGSNGEWEVEKVIQVPPKKTEGWSLPEMPGFTSDILISLDDRFLFLTNWLHGDIRQYDITNRSKPKMVGQLFLGGSIQSDSSVKVLDDPELESQPQPQPDPVVIKDKRLVGGPGLLQLSLDGKRLYVSSSFYSAWDQQFYPEMSKKGGWILQVDVDVKKGGLKLNDKFFVDLGEEPFGPVCSAVIRYPGGDCTSEIWP